MYDMRIIDYKLEVNTEGTKHNLLSSFKLLLLFRIDICDVYETAPSSVNVYVKGLWQVAFILLKHAACISWNLYHLDLPPPVTGFQDISSHSHWTRPGSTNPVPCLTSRGSFLVTRFWTFLWKSLYLHAKNNNNKKKTIFYTASCTTLY
jgi:hypothetical protein